MRRLEGEGGGRVLRPAVFALTLRTRASPTSRLPPSVGRGRRKIGLLNGQKSRLVERRRRERGEGEEEDASLTRSLVRSLRRAERKCEDGGKERTACEPTRNAPPPPRATPFITSDSAAAAIAAKSPNNPSHFGKDAQGPSLYWKRGCANLVSSYQTLQGYASHVAHTEMASSLSLLFLHLSRAAIPSPS